MDGDLLESIKRCWGELNEKSKMTETKDNAEFEEVVELRRRLTVLQEAATRSEKLRLLSHEDF